VNSPQALPQSAAASADLAFDIEVIERNTPWYPEQLVELPDPPSKLFCIGNPGLLCEPSISIVGTRNPTAYGLRTAREIATAFARSGVVLVSGMARGIDAVVHETALNNGAPTIAVLGTGVDVPYPSAHRGLHHEISNSGLVVSENSPGRWAHQGAFPRRNRIIAGLARATIVIEAGHKSGALNTATHALNINRPVAAVPGPIDSPQSAGTNHLVRDGAIVIASVEDALALAGIAHAPRPEPVQLSEAEARVWSALGAGGLGMDALASASRFTARECMGIVTALELRGLVECLVSGEVRRR